MRGIPISSLNGQITKIVLAEGILRKEDLKMATKEVSLVAPLKANGIFDFPSRFDWVDDLIPRGMFLRTPEWKAMRIEEFVKDGKLIVKAELPGMDPDKDIEVSIHDGFLTIKGERQEEIRDDHHCEFSYGSFSRSIALPNGCDEKSVHADYKNGILEVSLKLPDHVSNGKKIPINKAQH
jgi:HSP20 family molecular chaperone IbpA